MNIRSTWTRIAQAATVMALAGIVTMGCAPVDRGVPMGGRPIEGGTCDPNGVTFLQPEVCQK